MLPSWLFMQEASVSRDVLAQGTLPVPQAEVFPAVGLGRYKGRISQGSLGPVLLVPSARAEKLCRAYW